MLYTTDLIFIQFANMYYFTIEIYSFTFYLITDIFKVFLSCLFFGPLSLLSGHFWSYLIILLFSLSKSVIYFLNYFSGYIRNYISTLVTKNAGS